MQGDCAASPPASLQQQLLHTSCLAPRQCVIDLRATPDGSDVEDFNIDDVAPAGLWLHNIYIYAAYSRPDMGLASWIHDVHLRG